MRTKRTPRYNWSIYFEESKSKKAAVRIAIIGIGGFLIAIALACGAVALIHHIGKTHGLIWLLVPFGLIASVPLTYYLWPDKLEQ